MDGVGGYADGGPELRSAHDNWYLEAYEEGCVRGGVSGRNKHHVQGLVVRDTEQGMVQGIVQRIEGGSVEHEVVVEEILQVLGVGRCPPNPPTWGMGSVRREQEPPEGPKAFGGGAEA
eukprot:Hpha_TRINITY_DN18194_c0_g1::TRINITY_DN18194_c0_g1_i1::g.84679::m.84679